MKKQYTNPKLKVVKVRPSAMICVSAGFGHGYTDTMYGKQCVSADFDPGHTDTMYGKQEDGFDEEEEYGW